jgi:hypothetical protein
MAGTHRGGSATVGRRRGADAVAFTGGEGHAAIDNGRWCSLPPQGGTGKVRHESLEAGWG